MSSHAGNSWGWRVHDDLYGRGVEEAAYALLALKLGGELGE